MFGAFYFGEAYFAQATTLTSSQPSAGPTGLPGTVTATTPHP